MVHTVSTRHDFGYKRKTGGVGREPFGVRRNVDEVVSQGGHR